MLALVDDNAGALATSALCDHTTAYARPCGRRPASNQRGFEPGRPRMVVLCLPATRQLVHTHAASYVTMYLTPPTRKPFVWNELLSAAEKPATCTVGTIPIAERAHDRPRLVVGDLTASASIRRRASIAHSGRSTWPRPNRRPRAPGWPPARPRPSRPGSYRRLARSAVCGCRTRAHRPATTSGRRVSSALMDTEHKRLLLALLAAADATCAGRPQVGARSDSERWHAP